MNSSSRTSGKPNGGAPRGSGSTTSRKSPTKKFGKNLNKLTSQKLSAPPVPVPNSIRGTTSFSGSASSRNGLLLLSTKSSKSTTAATSSNAAAATNNTAYTPEGARAAGILAPLGRPSTAHDKLLQSAGSRTDAIGIDGTIDKSKSTATPAWGGITEKKKSSSTSADLPQPKKDKAPMLLQAGRPSVPINSSKEVPWSINERLINEPPSIDRRNNNNNNPTMINMERSGDNNRSSSYRGNYSGDYNNYNNRSTGDYNNYNNRNSGDYRPGGDYRNRDSPGGDYRSRDSGGDYRPGGDYRSSSSRFENTREYNSRPSRYNTGDSYQMASSRYSESSNSREYNNRNGGDTSYQSASRFGSSSSTRSTSSSGYNNNNNDSSLGGDYRSSKRHNDRDNMQQQQQQQEQQHHNEPPIVKDRFANFSSSNVVKDIAQNVEKVNINNEVNPNNKIKINTEDNPNWNKSSNPRSPGFWNRYHGSDNTAGPGTVSQSGDNETTATQLTTADNKPTLTSTPQSSGESPPAKDVDQVQYMSKLAKERQEKRRLEEEERMAAQKERAAARLRELEGKRMEEKKKEQQEQSETRKELSKPSMPLELLGKSKKDTTASTEPPSADTPPSSATSTAAPKLLTSPPKRASPPTNVEKKKVERTLYDPERPVWGKGGSKTDEQQEVPNTNKSPVHGPSPTPVAGFSATTDNKKSATPIPIQMVRLSDLRSDEQVGRGEKSGGGVETTVDNSQSSGGGGPRLLFDPTSGGMVSASVKNSKQKRSSKDTSKIISRGMMGSAIDGSDNTKPVRGKQGKGNRKDDATAPPQRSKKRQPSKKRNPRTRGVLYKLDKGGNYMTADGCEPDNGYGSHRVPGGKVKNPTAYAKLMKKEEVQTTTTAATDLPNDMTVPTTTTTTATEGFSTATEGFSYRNDPGFIQHQFEAQQQKILEDAWASLVENKDDEGGGDTSVGEQVVPTAKSGDDEYAAALAISPSRIGLNFDTNNNMDSIMLPPAIAANAAPSQEVGLAQFAFETTSTTTQQPAANPFASLGTGLWGGGSSAGGATTSTSYGDLGALTGWAPTPFSADTTADAAGQSSKLGLWGSPSALDDVGLGALGGDNKSEDTTNGTD